MKIIFPFLILSLAICFRTSHGELKITSVPDLIKSYGYSAEIHEVKTQDGYLLDLYRIPFGKSINNSILASGIIKKPVVLLVHCIFCTSSIFVIQGPNRALSLMLADDGYDVWMLNVRGTSPSKKHIRWSTNSKQYWDFSWHEMAIYDLPATIDYILETTKEKHLVYIGYSMGTTLFFAMASYKPEYNTKIEKMVALAPACYLSHSKGMVVDISVYIHLIEKYASDTQLYEVPPAYLNLKENLHNVCDYKNIFLRPSCTRVFEILASSSNENLELSKLSFFFLYYPDTTSVRTVTHFYQVKNSGKFRAYDYGIRNNMRKYGYAMPPMYNLTYVTTPIYLFYAEDDPITSPTDVRHLKHKLPNVIESYRINIPRFSHADFGWGAHVKEIVYDYVMKALHQHKNPKIKV